MSPLGTHVKSGSVPYQRITHLTCSTTFCPLSYYIPNNLDPTFISIHIVTKRCIIHLVSWLRWLSRAWAWSLGAPERCMEGWNVSFIHPFIHPSIPTRIGPTPCQIVYLDVDWYFSNWHCMYWRDNQFGITRSSRHCLPHCSQMNHQSMPCHCAGSVKSSAQSQEGKGRECWYRT